MAQTDDFPLDTLEHLEQAEKLKLEGKYNEALAILETLLLEDPANISALEEVADNELSLHHFDRAEAAASEAVALDQGSYTGFYILGFLRSHEEKWTEAIGLLRKANVLQPNCGEILRCLGWALFSEGQRAQGIVTLERALNLDPENTLTLCDLGLAYLQSRHFVKAKTLFLRSLDIEPGNLRARECLQALERMVNASQPLGQQTL